MHKPPRALAPELAPVCKRGRKRQEVGRCKRDALHVGCTSGVEVAAKKEKKSRSVDGTTQGLVFDEMAASAYLVALILSIPAYLLGLTFFRLFLHPLAKVPGPKLAAVTGWYEFWYDCVKHGQYAFHVQDLHKRYGSKPFSQPSSHSQ